nr:MAG TPA: hypothetical protein [Caudoviricetes sp.]
MRVTLIFIVVSPLFISYIINFRIAKLINY